MTVTCAAVICVRNEQAHLPWTLREFISQGIEVAIIDHGSDDRTAEICAGFMGKGVVAIEQLAWTGVFDLSEQLEAKNRLIGRLHHDWVIHADADEWLQSSRAGETLLDGITRLASQGYDAINFEEFVFLPNSAAGSEQEDYRREFLDYYFFAPDECRLMRAWRNRQSISNRASGGHRLAGPELRIAPEAFALRHYLMLSHEHAIRKYASRNFAAGDIAKGWHQNRLHLDAGRLQLPDAAGLKHLSRWDSVDFDRSQPMASHYWDWPQEHGACEVLVCIYTCDANAAMLAQFHASELGRFLHAWPGARVLEVRASPEVPRSRLDGNRLTVRGEERYGALSIKTQRMIAYCVQHFRFRRLLKIDDTCVMTQMQMGAREYGGKESLDAPALIAYLKGSSPDIEYTGFFFHAHAGREGAESWAHKKGITIDYERLFGNGPLPPFYDGKCYLLGRDFAEFVAEHGADVAAEQEQYFHGSEDVMIGRLYQQFQAGRA